MPSQDSHNAAIESPLLPTGVWQDSGRDWGRGELHFAVHDIGFRFTGVKRHCADRLDFRSGPIPPGRVRRSFHFRVGSGPSRFFNREIPDDGSPYRIDWRLAEGSIQFHGYHFAGTYHLEKRTAELWFGDAEPEVEAMELANCLRVVLTLTLLSEEILLLHASAVGCDGDTWIFFGPEGAGKTTLARLAPTGSAVFGDDLVALALRDGLRVSSLPFGSSLCRNDSESPPVSALFRIFQADHFCFQPMTHGSGVAALLGSATLFNRERQMIEQVLPLLLRIRRRVPVCGLRFTPSPGVYNWLIQNRSSIPR